MFWSLEGSSWLSHELAENFNLNASVAPLKHILFPSVGLTWAFLGGGGGSKEFNCASGRVHRSDEPRHDHITLVEFYARPRLMSLQRWLVFWDVPINSPYWRANAINAHSELFFFLHTQTWPLHFSSSSHLSTSLLVLSDILLVLASTCLTEPSTCADGLVQRHEEMQMYQGMSLKVQRCPWKTILLFWPEATAVRHSFSVHRGIFYF